MYESVKIRRDVDDRDHKDADDRDPKDVGVEAAEFVGDEGHRRVILADAADKKRPDPRTRPVCIELPR